jgi:hypothetical protein
MARYAAPGDAGSVVTFKPRYDHFIGGDYVAPVKGQYFENPTPITGQTFTEVARGTAEDVEAALDAAHGAAPAWGKTSVTERANILNKMADRIEANLEKIAIAESWENGKACRRPWPPTSRSPSTTSATSPAQSARRRAASPRSTRTRSPTTSTSRSAWSDRSSRGISRS